MPASASTDTDATTAINPQPFWNTSPNTLGPFLKQLVAWLEGKPHTQYSRLVEHGYVNTGRATACVSLNHIDLIANNIGTSGTWKNPCIVEAGDFTSLPTSATLYYRWFR